MAGLNEVDPQRVVTPDVIKVVNTLELVALCCEGEMVDDGVIKRTFRAGFMRHYQNVDLCGPLQGLGKTGRALLNENRAAMAFQAMLLAEHLQQDKPSGLGDRKA